MQGGIIIMMRGQWYKVPSDLFNDPGISKADMSVFAYVADRIKGEARPVSVRSIAAAAELSRRQVQLSLRKLCDRGYLSAQERTGAATVYSQQLLPYGSRKKEPDALKREYEAAIEYLSEDDSKGGKVVSA